MNLLVDRKPVILKSVFYAFFFVFSACEKHVQVPVPYNNTSFYQDVQDSPLSKPWTSKSVVMISSGNTHGTGFFVSKDGVMMTNDHVLGSKNCLKEGCYITLSKNFQKGAVFESQEVFAKPLHIDSLMDASIFQIFETKKNNHTGVVEKTKIKISNNNHLKLSDRSPKDFLNQEVFTIGHPLGALKKVTSLKVLDISGHNIRVAGAIISGQSGSPVLNQENEVIGIVKTSTMSFTDISPKGFNTSGDAVSIGRATQNHLQKLGQLSLREQSQGNLSELHSLEDEHILEDWPEYIPLFLNAKKIPSVLAEESPEELADQLHERCKTFISNLQKGFLAAAEKEKETLSDCLNIQTFLHCPKEKESPSLLVDLENEEIESRRWEYTFCPSLDKQQDIANTLLDLFDTSYKLNTSFSTTLLYQASTINSELSYQDLLREKLDEHQPSLSFSIATHILSNQIQTGILSPQYQGQDIVSLFVNYKQHPHYMFFIPDIIFGLGLVNNHYRSSINYRDTLFLLMSNPEVSLSDKFRLEVLAYKNGYL